jgi:hypothetical protein
MSSARGSRCVCISIIILAVRRLLIAGLVLCCLGSTQIAAAGINTWTSVGPEGAIVEAVVIDPTTTPTTLYAATLDGGVFKSTNAGVSWTARNTGLTVPGVRTLAIDPTTTPSTLYAGTAGDGVFKSTDGGDSWSAANAGLAFVDVFGLAIDPTTPTTLYVGTSSGGGGVFKSTDGGANWRAVFDPWGAAVQGLAIDPTTPRCGESLSAACILYAGTHGSGVFKSTDGGDSWNPVNTGMIDDFTCTEYFYNCSAFVGDVTIDPQNPNTLYAEAWTDGFQELMSFVFKSTNGGATWSPVLTVPIDSHVQGVTIDPQTPGTLYAVTGDHTGFGAVFKSTDRGHSWSDLSTGLTVRDVRALAVDPLTPTTLYAGTYGGGVFVSGYADVTLSGVSLNPTSVTGGGASTGTVTLSAAAPAGGVVVTLSSGNTAATVPTSVTVLSTGTTATFPVTTKAVTTSTTVTTTATLGGATRTATLTVNPPPSLTLLSFQPTSVTGGSASTGTVKLSGAAPAGGVVVTLSSNTAAATVPSGGVTVPAGSTTATFAVATSPVTTSTTVTISATGGGATRSAQLTVRRWVDSHST